MPACGASKSEHKRLPRRLKSYRIVRSVSEALQPALLQETIVPVSPMRTDEVVVLGLFHGGPAGQETTTDLNSPLSQSPPSCSDATHIYLYIYSCVYPPSSILALIIVLFSPFFVLS